MDVSDLTRLSGTLPKSDSVTVAASVFCMVEGARTMTSMVGSDRFDSPYGGELMGATYTGVIGVLASVIVKNPLPAIAALGSIVFFIVLYHWQENSLTQHIDSQ